MSGYRHGMVQQKVGHHKPEAMRYWTLRLHCRVFSATAHFWVACWNNHPITLRKQLDHPDVALQRILWFFTKLDRVQKRIWRIRRIWLLVGKREHPYHHRQPRKDVHVTRRGMICRSVELTSIDIISGVGLRYHSNTCNLHWQNETRWQSSWYQYETNNASQIIKASTSCLTLGMRRYFCNNECVAVMNKRPPIIYC